MFRIREGMPLFALIFLGSIPAESATVEELLERPKVSTIKISPTGDYLAVRVFEDRAHFLLFMDRKTLDILGGLNYQGNSEIGNFYWANNERVVAHVHELAGSHEAPRNYGELIAGNYDGTKTEVIFGYRSGEGTTGSILRKKTSERAWGEIIDPFPGDDRQILISSTSMSSSRGRRPVAMMLDIYTGMSGERIHSSNYPEAKFLTDSDGEVRFVSGIDENRNTHAEGLPEGAQEWTTRQDTEFGHFFTPVAITEDKKSVYVLDNLNSDKVGLHKLSLHGTDYEQIYVNDNVDITSVNLTADERNVFAIRIDKNYPSYLVLSKSFVEAKIFKDILQSFPGHAVSITSRSDDGRFWIIRTSSDVDPGTFYLFNKDEKSLRPLLKSLPGINSSELSAVEPVEIDSVDGLKISGYFTPAKTENDEVAPLVVLVHGGPRARDFWQYNPEVQALATQGFSVLQINYRGSSGFGDRFMSAGNLHWGDLVQQDIISGTRWAIANGKADEAKICIMGSSFGAYSAVQSAILEPDLFACAVANAGIYDLELLYKKGDIEEFYWGDSYLEEVIGRDEEQLKKFSPTHNVASLKSPLFIAHGKIDQRAPYEHAKRLIKELDNNDKQYELFVKTREAHGFYDTENQIEYMKLALEFLNKHLQQ